MIFLGIYFPISNKMDGITSFMMRLSEIPSTYLRIKMPGVTDTRSHGDGTVDATTEKFTGSQPQILVINSDIGTEFLCSENYSEALATKNLPLSQVPAGFLNGNKSNFVNALIEILETNSSDLPMVHSKLVLVMRQYILRDHLDSYIQELMMIMQTIRILQVLQSRPMPIAVPPLVQSL